MEDTRRNISEEGEEEKERERGGEEAVTETTAGTKFTRVDSEKLQW